MSDETITWPGKSGAEYKYWIHALGTTFKDVAGNYMFIKQTQPNRFVPIYIGETESLKDRLDNLDTHHKRACTKRDGATHLCAHTNSSGEEARRVEESDLIARWNPPCND